MRHCKEAVEEFILSLKGDLRSANLKEKYADLAVQFSSEDELEEAIALSGGHELFTAWMNQENASSSKTLLDRKAPQYEFKFNERMGIQIPLVYVDWEELPLSDREDIITRWESIRGQIPDRILELDRLVEALQLKVNQEENWEEVCKLFHQISTIASTINELNIWYRKQQEV